MCGSGDPVVAAGDSAPHSGSLRFALDGQFSTVTAGNESSAGATDSMTEQILRASIVYSPTRWANLVLQAPYNRKKQTTTDSDGNVMQNQSVAGLGDVDLGARLFVWNSLSMKEMTRQHFAVTLGSTIPTGKNDQAENGARVDEHLQLGRGAFGPYVGLMYAFHQDPWNFSADVADQTYRVNRLGYRYGPSVKWSAMLTYRPVDALAFTAGIVGRQAQPDRDGGGAVENTGGLLLAAAPGIRVNVAGGLWLQASAHVPIAQRLTGVQHVGPMYMVSIQYAMR